MLSRVAVALWSIADTKPTTANWGVCVLAQPGVKGNHLQITMMTLGE